MRIARCITFALLLCFLLLTPSFAYAQQTFTVSVAEKSSAHPYAGQGAFEAYVIDGAEARELTLVRGRTYTFRMSGVPALHPFYLSTSSVGAGEGVYSTGVSGNFASGNGTLTFDVPLNAPDLLWYQCAAHEYMGWRINVTDAARADVALVAEGLAHPIVVVASPDATGRLFIADQTGQIHVVGADGSVAAEPFLDLGGRMVGLNPGYDERGLLGLAFHPDYASNGRFFVYYSAPLRAGGPAGFNHTSHVSEFVVSATDPSVADPTSERILLQVDQPQGNHNGGTIAFGPEDGYLYIALGDGGGRDDEGDHHVPDWYGFNAGGNGQDVEQNLLGSLLRIDVDTQEGSLAYGIPDDNPFVGMQGVAAEQYAYGFRNPYRFAFDPGGEHLLLVGDAGQELYEEVSVVTAGGNYGWNVKEGTHCFDAANPTVVPQTCPGAVGAGHPKAGAPLIDPVVEFLNGKMEGGVGLVVVGGNMYRGSALPSLSGQYVFGAWSRNGSASGGLVLVAQPQPSGLWPFNPLDITNANGLLDHYVLSFGQDLAGEVYVLTTQSVGPVGNTGKVWRLVPSGTGTDLESIPPQRTGLQLRIAGPNPFSDRTAFAFDVPRLDAVRLQVYDLLGRRVATLIDGVLPPGPQHATWDAEALGLPAGLYVARLASGSQQATVKVTLLR